ncbi:hypothetical protein HU200_043457 [Digitaria exilis]|uniref:NAC domain-containing protein n=1 Tax=Digitaria exilis TaxID=1010633 RepID=A0A835BE53_9POAL|nr:hypothetical protein HU200_043457 [Digitaria exilis]
MMEMAMQSSAAKTATMMADAWDYKGRAAVRSSSGGWSSAAMILGVELNERLTTLGIAVNLVSYLTGTMHLSSAASANAVTNFLDASFMLCLLGGFVADTYLGRYLTIAIFTAVEAAGMAVLTVSTAAPGLRPPPCAAAGCVPPNGTQLGVLYLGLYLTALGTGGLKSSVSGFGSDQFDESDGGERRRMARFFSWFFFFISIGSLLAVTALVYAQDHLGRRWGYGACVAAILLGLAVFLAGTTRYRFKKLVGSPLTQIAAVTAAAWRKRALPLPPDPAQLYDVDGAGEDAPPSPAPCTLTDVEEVKQVLRMLPTWATTIPFWTVYAQMTTFSVTQAEAMDRRLGGFAFEIPAGSLTVFLVGSILLTVPVYDRLVVPLASPSSFYLPCRGARRRDPPPRTQGIPLPWPLSNKYDELKDLRFGSRSVIIGSLADMARLFLRTDEVRSFVRGLYLPPHRAAPPLNVVIHTVLGKRLFNDAGDASAAEGPVSSLAKFNVVNVGDLNAIVKETMRVHPIGPLFTPRVVREDVAVAGYDIPKGMLVLINIGEGRFKRTLKSAAAAEENGNHTATVTEVVFEAVGRNTTWTSAANPARVCTEGAPLGALGAAFFAATEALEQQLVVAVTVEEAVVKLLTDLNMVLVYWRLRKTATESGRDSPLSRARSIVVFVYAGPPRLQPPGPSRLARIRSMACVSALPPGILFAPEDEVAVEHYLLPRLLGLPLPIDGLILDDDPLSAPPQELLERNGRREEAFFFAEGQPRCVKGTRQKRTCAGGGWWEGQKTCAEGSKLRLPCGGGEEAAWRKKALNFHCGGGGGGGKKGSSGWVMHEYAVTAPEDLAQSPLRLYHIRLSSYGRKQSGAMEVPRELGLPPGFLFAPDDGDAVAHYLLPRLLGQPLPLDGLIVDDDPLSAPPWELLDRNGRKEDAFFFALGQVKNSKGSRQKRTCAGGGFWNGERTCVDGEQLHLGGGAEVMTWRKKALSFQDGGEKGSTGWVMHEYAITAPDHLAESQLMLYRIRFSGHGKKRKRGEADPCAGEVAPPAARRVAEDALLSMPISDPICSSTLQADQAGGNCVNGAEEHHAATVTIPAEQNNTPAIDDMSWDLSFLDNIDIDELLRSIELPSPNPDLLPADPAMHHGCMEPADSFLPMPNQSYAAC